MNSDIKFRQKVRLTIDQLANSLLYDPNISMIDYGSPEHNGRIYDDEEPVIRIHVRKKFFTQAMLDKAIKNRITNAKIPKTINGIRIDIPEGNFWLQQDATRRITTNTYLRRNACIPMQGGISISRSNGTYATLGALVVDRDTHEQMILSNAHVLAGHFGARKGQFILQPGRLDGGKYKDDLVARYERSAIKSHNLDAAVAKLNGNRNLVNNQFGIGSIKGIDTASKDMVVTKSGRRTNITTGQITGVDGVKKIYYGGIPWKIKNVITIDQMKGSFREISAGGDSGSIWMNKETNKAIALHFAGMNYPKERALAIDISSILDALNVDLAME